MLFEEEDWKDGKNAKELETCLITQAQCVDSLLNKDDAGNQVEAPMGPTKKKRKRKRNTAVLPKKLQVDQKCRSETVEKMSDRIKSKKQGDILKSTTRKHDNTSESYHLVDSHIKKTEKPNIDKPEKRNWKRHKLSEMLERKTPTSADRDVSLRTEKLKTDSLKNTHNSSRSVELRNAATTKLQSAQFRFINEQLYSRCSRDAKKLFMTDSNAFIAYHTGFNQQVAKWPVNPLDVIINFIKKRPSRWIIGDFGCGDARLGGSVKNQVYSFDLVSVNERVTVADISHVPLDDGSLDVAVFCLSLMGTNFIDFIKEANRTLKSRGLLKIAEVASRFSSVRKFVMLMKKLGFDLERKDDEDTHFIMFDFRKVKSYQCDVVPPVGLLKPCVYKKR